MDSCSFHNNIKVEKANAIRKYRRLEKISAMLRFIELGIFFVILTRFSTQLPFVFKVPSEFFQGLYVTLISPRFVFVLGNVILVVLLMQSGQFTPKDGDKNSNKVDFYDEYMKNCRKNQQKQQISSTHEGRKVTSLSRERKIQKFHPENLERMHQEEPHRHELKQSTTGTCRKSVNHSHNPIYQNGKLVLESKKRMDASYAEDEMSSDEFRRTVEAFIARQQRILREHEILTVFPYEK
ncbi:uncharacterized protein LOC111412622 [Olea europaea var. sylvestris]|uniref:uncharacterized protein LOC111412622 n=1 Tax=Olea europaea var. sylvestris TaxID=158386 RepID=UPI000C1D17D5|nr:uncharacterized protein LOC111412622 [Olea europaea var. sylvestris]